MIEIGKKLSGREDLRMIGHPGYWLEAAWNPYKHCHLNPLKPRLGLGKVNKGKNIYGQGQEEDDG